MAGSGDLRPGPGGMGEADAADAPAEAGRCGDGVAVAQGCPLEAGPGQPHDACGGEIDDGAAAGEIDEADVAGAAFRDSVATHPADAAGPGHNPVARRQLEVTGLDGGAPEPASAPEGGAGKEVEVLRLAGGG